MDQTFYILDTATDGLNFTFIRTGNCISDTQRHCGNNGTGEICHSSLYTRIRKNRKKKKNNDCLAKLVEPNK